MFSDYIPAILVFWGIIGCLGGTAFLANGPKASKKQAIFVGVLAGPIGWISIAVYFIIIILKIVWKALA